MARVHIDRKSLKEDAFRSFGFELIDHAYRHRRRYIGGAVIVVLIVAGAFGYRAYRAKVIRDHAADFYALEQAIDANAGSLDTSTPKHRAAIESFLSRYPDGELTPIAWMYLARLHWAQNDLEQAEFALNQVLKTAEPKSVAAAQARIGLAKLAEARGNVGQAAALYEQLDNERFGDLKAIELGRLAMAANDKDKAKRLFGEVANRVPPSVLSRWASEALAYLP